MADVLNAGKLAVQSPFRAVTLSLDAMKRLLILAAALIATAAPAAAEAAQPVAGFIQAQYRQQDRNLGAREDDRPRWSLSEVVRRLRGSRQGQMVDARESTYGGRPVYVIIWEYPGGRIANIYVDARTGGVIGED
ncbi:hypothetical protein [Brevundimonas sp.]|uniref:PepSY domain-containing protein n=1 Tax=Brevundimonas sp. TaxID=1871086 RepID=UPI0025CD0EE6|nr:hypothetical protein [Brevundimonas sp.]